MHTQSAAEVAAVPLVTAFFGHVVHATCADCPTSGLKVDLPQLISEPPTQYCPARQILHSSAEVRLVALPDVPGGQGVPAAEPLGQ